MKTTISPFYEAATKMLSACYSCYCRIFQTDDPTLFLDDEYQFFDSAQYEGYNQA
jgi:hypothetical protein